MPRAVFICCLLFLSFGKCFAFEGFMKFVLESPFDTLYYSIYINADYIRIDEKASNENQVRKISIYNRKLKTIYALSPEHKQYVLVPYNNTANVEVDNNFEIYPTRNYKVINNKRCMQWRVKNKDRQTEVVYWLSSGDYSFYSEFMNNHHRTDNLRDFFVHIPNNEKYMPMLIEERTPTRELKHRLRATSILPEHIENSVFEIPKSYHLIEL